ncbi:MAG: TonB-dependent receptor [Tannerella sp.]|nr:TonB-dependent receptor [Tannerella sp.]
MKFIFIAIVLFQFSVQTVCGQIAVKGFVTDEKSKKPVIGAAVIQKETKKGVTTEADGSFTLLITGSLPVSLSVNLIGYRSEEIDVFEANDPIQISLKEDYNLLNEVVVTGYSTQQRKFVSGAIASVNLSDDIKNSTVSDLNQILQGRVTGVQVLSNTGVPGGSVTFRVRGNNSINAGVDPLYIVDGVFINNSNLISTSMGGQSQSNPLADFNPSDIENIVILKDANATAIYGSQGANGVVVITTKRGQKDTKAKISLKASYGLSEATKKFQVVSGPEYGLLANESTINTAIDNGLDPSSVQLPFPDAASLPTYDRVSDIFRTASVSEYELAAQGGTKTGAYYIGIGYTKQESVMKPSYFERFSGRLNYDIDLTNKLKVGTSVNLSRAYRNPVATDNTPSGLVNSTVAPPSYLPIFKEDNSYAKYVNVDNHLAIIEHSDNNSETWRTVVNLYGEYQILPELKFRSSWSLDNVDNTDRNYFDTFLNSGATVNGSASYYNAKNSNYTAEQLFTYNKLFKDKHHLNVLLGNTVNSVQRRSGSVYGQGFATNELREISVAATTTGSSSGNESRLLSYFGKAIYTLNNKYVIDGSIRADASSRFGSNKRWGYFPALGATWNVGQEEYIKKFHLFDELKFRGSFGYTGNQNGIGSYAALGLWSANATYIETAGISPSQLANPDLTWETTRQTDVGVEFSVLKNRLFVNFDYYNKYTYDLLLDVPVPYRSGFSSFLQNYGAVSNKGLELSLQTVNIDAKSIRWTTEFNVSTNRNKIEKLASDIALGASGRNTSILKEGYPINSFYVYKQLYVDPQTGNAVYEDVNKDGIITAADRQVIGNAIPKYIGGFTNNVSYKNFSLNVFFYFQQGNKIMNMYDFFFLHGGNKATGYITRQLERWQKPGDITDIPRVTKYAGNVNENGGPANNYGGIVQSINTRYLEDGSFIRLKNLSLSYDVPKRIIAPWHLSQLKATVSASNLLTFTKYNGTEPEVNAQSSNQNTQGYDWASVPQPKTLLFTLNASF